MASPARDPLVIDLPGGRTLDCRPGALREIGCHVMGILNVTPDSFADGGRYDTTDAALRQAERMLAEGAAILDIGGESTRPRGQTYGAGARAVGEEDELARVLPAVEAIRARFPGALLSVDTYKPRVAREALARGVHLVNDVTGLRLGDTSARAAARWGAAVCVMHALGRPGEMPHEHTYADVVGEVAGSLGQSVEVAERAGVRGVLVDPGFGFGKSAAENLRLVAHAGTLAERVGRPVLIGASRKSTIGHVLRPGDPAPVEARLHGSVGIALAAARWGAAVVRVHDVGPTVDALRLFAAVSAER
jgi:dihydropteroate synthase